MNAYTLLSLGAFIGATASYALPALFLKTREYAVDDPVIKNPPPAEKEKDSKIFIPRTLARWPWPYRLNPHHAEVTKDSDDWLKSLCFLSPKAQKAFIICDHSHLGSFAYPIASKEHLRTCCDFMNQAFLIDEYIEVSGPDVVRQQKEIVMDALRNPHKPRPKGEWVGGEVSRQFWELAIKTSTKQSQKRFVEAFDRFFDGVIQQAIDRGRNYIRDINSYISYRRNTIGMQPAFALLELGLDIPDEVMSHPAVQDMFFSAIDMICVDNDIVSYNVEQSRGDVGHNMVTIAMKELGTDVNGAMLWIQDYHTELEQKFLAAMASLPEWDEPLNSQVREYCNGLAQWVRGYDDWQFETKRYLGARGLEIKEKRWMSLMPKKRKDPTPGPVVVDSSLM